MRGAAGVLLLLLAGCSQDLPAPDPDSLIECALGGATAFTRECAAEHGLEGGIPFLVVRHPDGSFRRFEVVDDGRGIAAADGADRARTAIEGNLIAVTVESDRYRIPITASDHDAE